MDMKSINQRRTGASLLIGIASVLLLGCSELWAQGCAMCAASAPQGGQALTAINHGVLVLMIPSVLMVVGFLAFVIIRRSD